METQQVMNYRRITEAIVFLRQNFKHQPSLEEIAEHVHLSPFHFQRMFQDWAGVTPKQFVQYLSVEYAKNLIKQAQISLFEAAYETGLSGTGRLHDLFIKIEGMTPGEYKNGGENLNIHYNFYDSPFGTLLIASTDKGICHIAFADNREETLADLHVLFPNAQFQPLTTEMHHHVLLTFEKNWDQPHKIKLHLKGSPFQIKIWETLLKVPLGALTTYSLLAEKAGYSGAARAVGTAVAQNPIAFLIPCHRVIKSTGEIGQYHWGNPRKNAMIVWEAANI